MSTSCTRRCKTCLSRLFMPLLVNDSIIEDTSATPISTRATPISTRSPLSCCTVYSTPASAPSTQVMPTCSLCRCWRAQSQHTTGTGHANTCPRSSSARRCLTSTGTRRLDTLWRLARDFTWPTSATGGQVRLACWRWRSGLRMSPFWMRWRLASTRCSPTTATSYRGRASRTLTLSAHPTHRACTGPRPWIPRLKREDTTTGRSSCSSWAR